MLGVYEMTVPQKRTLTLREVRNAFSQPALTDLGSGQGFCITRDLVGEKKQDRLFPQSQAGALSTENLAMGGRLTNLPVQSLLLSQGPGRPYSCLVTALGAVCPATRETGVGEVASRQAGRQGACS